MSTDALYPFAGDHAIQNVAFVLEWPVPLTPSELLKVRGLHAQLQTSFPVMNEMRSLTINFAANPGGQTLSSNSNEIGGIQFLGNPLGPGMVSRMLQVSPLNCIVVINDYSRWEKVWGDVRRWFMIVAPSLFETGHQIPTIGLQYTDVFNWRKAPETMELSEIFLKDTDFLPKNVFKLKSLWHSHHGYFDTRKILVEHKLLENINVGLADNNGQRSITILTVHKATLLTPLWDMETLQGTVDTLMSDLHLRNKKILSSLLSTDVCAKIKLVV